jgi:C_GCAxxG_C_C family probable redox protein
MSRSESAAALMAAKKVNCSQAVLTAYCEELGLDRILAMKLAMGFGGGMGRSGLICGAVTGAFMVIGLKQQQTTQETKDRVYGLVREFSREFARIHGSIECKKLLGYDVSRPEELAIVQAKGLFTTVCPQMVAGSIEILEKMPI